MTYDYVTIARSLQVEAANEAETRHKVIDYVLHDILGWPRARTKVEEFISPGFADYVLTRSSGDFQFLIEAKRVGKSFELAVPHKSGELYCYASIKQLQSDPNTKAAMQQVREYCMDVGCEYAAITNGIEWIAFKCFEKGKRWDELKAFVVRDIEFFSRENVRALNAFSYIAITEHASLVSTLSSAPPKDRQVYVAKDRISAYSHPITANRLASTLRPIVMKLFGVIEDGQTELMDKCYVADRNYEQVLSGMRSVIKDSLTPYFADFGVLQLEDTGKGGAIGGKIAKNLKERRGGEVLVLFGGKGAGKSTFLRRLLRHNPPRWLKENASMVVVDMLNIPEERSRIRHEIWRQLVRDLDTDRILDSSRDTILRDLFADRFATAQRQELAGLPRAGELYNDRLNSLLVQWKSDLEYCAVRLADRNSRSGKGLVVVIDNTDQYSGPEQDFCFTTAQEISRKLSCVTLISMREERFHNSKLHGVLDAFQNSGFHLSSPKPSLVFLKRLEYTTWLLRDRSRRQQVTQVTDDELLADCCKYLDIVASGIRDTNSPLNNFLSACGHGDIRLTLDLFRSFLLSGYTNVQEMLDAGRWNFQIHQVVKPVMVPTRYFYDEGLSDIPNIYQTRDSRLSSHFTSLRILRKLSKNVSGGATGFTTVAELTAYFVETFRMSGDFEKCMDILLKQALLEANNRLDYFDQSVDQVRITAYGMYMLNELAFTFTYLDLVCSDCNYFEERACNDITAYANDEYKLFVNRQRSERVNARINRTESFIKYLCDEEARENELYDLKISSGEAFSDKLTTTFAMESSRVIVSANKQRYNRQQ